MPQTKEAVGVVTTVFTGKDVFGILCVHFVSCLCNFNDIFL